MISRSVLFIVLTLIGVVLTLSLAGCATGGTFDTPFKAEFDRGANTPRIYTYAATPEEMNILCFRKPDAPLILGCAHIPFTADGVCSIILFQNGPQSTKDHEALHCRYGRWHA